MNKMIAEQISMGLQKLYAVIELMGYHDLSDLQREFALLDIMIMQRKQKLLKEVLTSETMERR